MAALDAGWLRTSTARILIPKSGVKVIVAVPLNRTLSPLRYWNRVEQMSTEKNNSSREGLDACHCELMMIVLGSM